MNEVYSSAAGRRVIRSAHHMIVAAQNIVYRMCLYFYTRFHLPLQVVQTPANMVCASSTNDAGPNKKEKEGKRFPQKIKRYRERKGIG
jgi:hypothetical protein